MTSFGVYVHFPWCRSRCDYCDFAIALGKPAHIDYKNVVARECASKTKAFADRVLSSIYIGGGTPSLWDPNAVKEMIKTIRGSFHGEPKEITLEVNPVDCTKDALRTWLELGITRLSVGLQSLDGKDLVTLGRDRSMGHDIETMNCVASAGFDSFSVDVILGVPGSSALNQTLLQLIEIGAPHISIYELTLEKGTRLEARVRRGEFSMMSEDDLSDQLTTTRNVLRGKGFDHYEISSFAKPGHRAVHNSIYWESGEWLGLGAGATSQRMLDGGGVYRWTNHSSASKYMSSDESFWHQDVQELTAGDVRAERIWLGLRTERGVSVSDTVGFEAVIDALERDALVGREGDRIVPTYLGFLFANAGE